MTAMLFFIIRRHKWGFIKTTRFWRYRFLFRNYRWTSCTF